jgi:hypothetical protein
MRMLLSGTGDRRVRSRPEGFPIEVHEPTR